ncbi:putative Holliday junction resolvase [Thermodesulfitimonas autotrophica]|uniref:Putative pre-16S rRNA nuclease n=1 Tax=Thermodesulfitimonas autotrophica TaxID=1894989 RepID=A0A3N5ATE6_9THEO|nr:Holliday junction resolvase RuvX [Thermodesulfitimonas autotrophica]RPF46910.1 putative Holliday junction resolvase [Thermodesulfitimonas autotrophica]
MRFLGLDVGDRTIGVALSDPLGITAQGLTVLERGSINDDVAKILSLVAAHDVCEVVVGLPRSLNGRVGPQARKVLEFAARLEKEGLAVKLWDERFSTRAAERHLIAADVRREKRRRVIDKLAAVLILQNYLDHRRLTDPGRA